MDHAVLLVALLVSGCVEGAEEIFAATPNAMRFANDIYPVLLRDCGFPQCHGDAGRAFQVFGPGRTRASPPPSTGMAVQLFDPVQAIELQVSYERARSMLTRASSQDDYLLLRKALDVRAGGAAHGGTDALGYNVYRTREDPTWQRLQAWALDTEAAVR